MVRLVSVWDGMPHDLKRPRVSVLIPALNEARNLPHVAARMPIDIDEIVFVNGILSTTPPKWRFSYGQTPFTSRRPARVRERVACGMAVASGDIIVLMDADGKHRPSGDPAVCRGADLGC